MAIAGAVAAVMVTSGSPAIVAVAAALAVGLLCGLWNGVLVTFLEIQPIIAPLVLMVAGRGLAQLVTEGSIVTFSDPVLIFIGTGAFQCGLPAQPGTSLPTIFPSPGGGRQGLSLIHI